MRGWRAHASCRIHWHPPLPPREMPVADDAPALDALLDFLKRNRGFDFTGYKRTTLERRLHKRMQAVPVCTYERNLDLLQADPEEFTKLFETMLINVTRFLCDDPPRQLLSDKR